MLDYHLFLFFFRSKIRCKKKKQWQDDNLFTLKLIDARSKNEHNMQTNQEEVKRASQHSEIQTKSFDKLFYSRVFNYHNDESIYRRENKYVYELNSFVRK